MARKAGIEEQGRQKRRGDIRAGETEEQGRQKNREKENWRK